MSSRKARGAAASEERELTLIIVPHGHLETKSYVISYGHLKVLVACVVAVFLVVGVVLATWFPVMAQAARVPALVRELNQLEEERARVAELARTLQQVEDQYERVRQMLGADAPGQAATAQMLPPLRRDSTSTEARLGADAPEQGATAPMVPPLRRDSSSTEASSTSADTVNAVVDSERRQTRQNGSQ